MEIKQDGNSVSLVINAAEALDLIAKLTACVAGATNVRPHAQRGFTVGAYVGVTEGYAAGKVNVAVEPMS